MGNLDSGFEFDPLFGPIIFAAADSDIFMFLLPNGREYQVSSEGELGYYDAYSYSDGSDLLCFPKCTQSQCKVSSYRQKCLILVLVVPLSSCVPS